MTTPPDPEAQAMSEKSDSPNKPAPAGQNEQVLATLASTLSTLKYGHVGLTIHEGRVVQLDVTEKKRFSGS